MLLDEYIGDRDKYLIDDIYYSVVLEIFPPRYFITIEFKNGDIINPPFDISENEYNQLLEEFNNL